MPRTTFLSHAHVDNAICAQYATALRAQGVDLWIDLTNMQDGHSLSNDITYQLVQRQAFVVMLTSTSNASHWVGQELETYSNLVNDRRYRLVDGMERLIVPVLLEADLPMLVRDSETGQQRASNWAKIFRLKAIDAVNRSFAQVVDDIAHALGVHGSITPPPLALPVTDTEPIPILSRLARLGFVGQRVHATGVEYMVPPTCPVPGGIFTMGSDKAHDPQAFDQEIPQYDIQVPTFAIGTYPVTVVEYANAVKAGVVQAPHDYTWPKDSWVPQAARERTTSWKDQQARPDHPVVCVSWLEAMLYVEWLAKVAKQPWRLPTEAEWEKAARWDTKAMPPHARIYPWGDQWDKARANTNDGGPTTTTPVGQYAEKGDASPYGAHDMAGNVWEWTSSIWHDRPPYNPVNCDNNSDRKSDRVLRGGSWNNYPVGARTACRLRGGRVNFNGAGGFRMALDAGASA